MKFEEETISSKTIYDGHLIDYVVKQVRLPNGETASREIVEHPGAVAIMPFTSEGKMIFVEQFRKPLEKAIFEIPAGKIDLTDSDPRETGIRELEEETGFYPEKFELITPFYTTPGFSNEYIYLYRAEGLKKIAKPRAGDEDEFIEIKTLTFEEAWAAFEEKRIIDGKTIIALLYWKIERLSLNKKED